MNHRIPVLLDGDPGHDDAIAWMLAATGLDIRGVSSVAGNQTIEKTTRNALRICTLLGIRAPVETLKHINTRLHELSEKIGLHTPLTTYVARHTYATVLKRSGVSVALISESLGHSDLSTTQIYLDSFENSQIDAAMQHLL